MKNPPTQLGNLKSSQKDYKNYTEIFKKSTLIFIFMYDPADFVDKYDDNLYDHEAKQDMIACDYVDALMQ